jgi:hypothetical protein
MLVVRTQDAEWLRLGAPHDMSPRAWLLAVVAAQLEVVDGRVHCRVRAHLTGHAQADVLELAQPTVVHVSLIDDHVPLPELPSIPAGSESSLTGLSLFLDGVHLATTEIDPAELDPSKRLRAFAHTWCRHLKSGAIEPGYDLTRFTEVIPGRMYPRSMSENLTLGQTVSWALRWPSG